MDLFKKETQSKKNLFTPLADRMRPQSLEEFIGQEHILSENAPLRQLILKGELTSVIFWGPPGSGKTTLAFLIAKYSNADFVSMSAVTSGVKDVKQVIDKAYYSKNNFNKRTILFVDEIHRFNKAQQDAFLPFVENGTITLIGATTENPSFEIISPLLSRCKVFTLNILSADEIKEIVKMAIADKEKGLGQIKINFQEDSFDKLSEMANGDARIALNTLEFIYNYKGGKNVKELTVARKDVEDAYQKRALMYDKAGEEHYNLISALHKSLRSSDPDAAVYWLLRMLEAGEDPLYVARRMVRFAIEDIGNADPNALVIANAAKEAYHFLGSPEGELALAQAAIYLATAPKSNAVYKAYLGVEAEIRESGYQPVPMHIRNAPTDLMKDLGYGKDYKYDHEYEMHYSGQECLPEKLIGKEFYKPSDFGFEKEIKKRLEWWRKLKEKIKKKV